MFTFSSPQEGHKFGATMVELARARALGNKESEKDILARIYPPVTKEAKIDLLKEQTAQYAIEHITGKGHHTGIENGTQDRFFNGACHWGESFNNGAYPNYGQFKTADYPVQGDFHLFTLIWTEDTIAMYLDQDKYPEVEPYFQLSLLGKEVNEPGHYFNHPFYLVLNLAVGGFFPNMPAAEKYPEVIPMDDPSFMKVTALPEDGTPAKMYVDYIRVYKKRG